MSRMGVICRVATARHRNLGELFRRGAELMHMAVSSERVIADGCDAVGQFELSGPRCWRVGVTGADIGGRRARGCRVSPDDNLGVAGGGRCRCIAGAAE